MQPQTQSGWRESGAKHRRDLSERPDSVLVSLMAASRDSGEAWAQLRDRHYRSVHAAARTVLGNRPDCADVVAAVFEDLWRAPHHFDPERGTLPTFLRQQARTRGIDLLRAEHRRRRREVTDHCRSLGTGVPADTEGAALARLQAGWIHEALLRLPDAERRPIQMAYIEGLSYTTVAALLGLPEGTVKGRIRRGLRRLRADGVARAPEAAGTRWEYAARVGNIRHPIRQPVPYLAVEPLAAVT